MRETDCACRHWLYGYYQLLRSLPHSITLIINYFIMLIGRLDKQSIKT